MADIQRLFTILCCLIASSVTQRPPDSILASESYKPDVKLSLLTSKYAHEGGEIQLECSAKPKNRSVSSQPDGVHWIKGQVGIPDAGARPGSERFVKETAENDRGEVIYTLTIKDVEPKDADKYMCIVMVGKTGFFPSNELPIEVERSVEKSNEDTETTDEVDDIDEILKWKDRVLELSQKELKKLADAVTKDEERKKVKKQTENDKEKPQNDDTLSLTPEESIILARKSAIEDMSESELKLLAQAMRKEKAIKTQQEDQRQRKQQEEELKAKAEKENNKKKSDTLKLNAEEKAILKRKDELPDMTDEELKLLSSALRKERNIKEQKETNKVKQDSKEASGDSKNELTEEERDILKRKDRMKDMSSAELKIMSRALTKQRKIQEAKKRSDTELDAQTTKKVDDELTEEELKVLSRKEDVVDMSPEELEILGRALRKELKLQSFKDTKTVKPHVVDADDMTEAEMKAILSRRDKVMEMSQDELKMFAKALTKEKKLKEERKNQPGFDSSGKEDMSEAEMREILKWKNGDMSKLTREQITKLGDALLKQKSMKEQNQNDPLENEESIRDEL